MIGTVEAISEYYSLVQKALSELCVPAASMSFDPGPNLPPLDATMREFFAPASIRMTELGSSYRGVRLALMDLTLNPETQTTKTVASLLMVARAVAYIRDTGKPITIVTPSSANKAVALRNAVCRAISLRIVPADSLNIVTIVPKQSIHKLRESELITDPWLRRANPICVLESDDAEAVKAVASSAATSLQSQFTAAGRQLWYTLRLENYLAADVVRAAVENDLQPQRTGDRLHAHSVSSAYGLLGHDYGRRLLGLNSAGLVPQYLLVQHLGTPDMVVSLNSHLGLHDAEPNYSLSDESGCYMQDTNPSYPAVTFDPEECLEPTFYSRSPVTSSAMNAIIAKQGGAGIIVSSAECIERYGQARQLLATADVSLPSNPLEVLEWSLPMAITGVLNAIDRGLTKTSDVVIHGSGIYTRGDYEPLSSRDYHRVRTAAEVESILAASVHLDEAVRP